jgi:hypothetical protein
MFKSATAAVDPAPDGGAQEIGMELWLRKKWKEGWTAIGRWWHDATNWPGRQRWLRQPLQQLRRIPAAGQAIARQLRRVPDAIRSLLHHLGRVGGALCRLPTQLKVALLWLARLRPNARFWSLVVGLLTVPLGAFLIGTPVRELATGRELDLRSLLTATWLLTGVATLTAGLGMLFRAPSFRTMLWLALLCSLPLPAAFGHHAYTLMAKMEGADEATQRTLQPWVDGGIQSALLFLGLSVYLGTLLRLRPLRSLQCTTPLLRGRAGFVLAPCYGGAFGMGVGYSLWQGLRHVAEREDLQFLSRALGVVRLEYFAVGCGALGASWLARRRWRRPRAAARTPLLRGRAGFVLAPCLGGAFGMGVGYSLWQGLRYVAEREDLRFLDRVLGLVRLEHFAYGCGALGAAWLARRWWHRRPGGAARTAPPVQRTAPPAAASPGVSAPPPPKQPAAPQPSPAQVRRPQVPGWMASRP